MNINDEIDELKLQVLRLRQLVEQETNNESDLLILNRVLFSIGILKFNNQN